MSWRRSLGRRRSSPRSQYAWQASESATLPQEPPQAPVSPASSASPLDTAQLAAGWQPLVERFAASESGRLLQRFLETRRANGAALIPARPLRALELTAFDDVQAVILGQDPYHGPGQANGLAFCVPAGVTAPPSLRNIYNEVERDIGRRPAPGALEDWARQGVLLLNAVLTVEPAAPGSHAGAGWEALSESIVAALAADARPKAFLLWGAQAQRLGRAIAAPHLVLRANHPSPLAARRGATPFIGSGHFSAANEFLRASRNAEIRWA